MKSLLETQPSLLEEDYSMPAKAIGIAGVAYASGIASIFAIDLIIAGQSNTALVSDWAFFRSLLPFIPPLALFGLNMGVIRYPELVGISILLYTCLLCAILTFLILGALFNSNLLYGAGLLSVSASLLGGAILRSRQLFIQSQIYLNLWKVSALVITVSMFLNFEYMMIGISMTTIFLSAWLTTKMEPAEDNVKVSFRHHLLYKNYLVNSLKLALSGALTGVSASLFLLCSSIIYDDNTISSIFKLIVIVQSPAVIASGFAGFILTPLFRDKDSLAKTYVDNRFAILLSIAVAHILLSLASLKIGQLAYGSEFLEGATLLIWMLAIESVIRVFYTAETSYFGARFRPSALSRLIKRSLLAIMAAFLIISLTYLFGFSGISILIFISMIHWIIRVILVDLEVVEHHRFESNLMVNKS